MIAARRRSEMGLAVAAAVDAINGVSEKIEGFFDVCRVARLIA